MNARPVFQLCQEPLNGQAPVNIEQVNHFRSETRAFPIETASVFFLIFFISFHLYYYENRSLLSNISLDGGKIKVATPIVNP